MKIAYAYYVNHQEKVTYLGWFNEAKLVVCARGAYSAVKKIMSDVASPIVIGIVEKNTTELKLFIGETIKLDSPVEITCKTNKSDDFNIKYEYTTSVKHVKSNDEINDPHLKNQINILKSSKIPFDVKLRINVDELEGEGYPNVIFHSNKPTK